MLPWLLFFFSYSSALLCYKGQFQVLSNGQSNFETFRKLNCTARHAACARWKIAHRQTTTNFYGCTSRCRGDVVCCRSDLCNNRWREEYRNLTREVVEVVANPDATQDERLLLVEVVPSRLHLVRKGQEEEKTLGEPEMKKLEIIKPETPNLRRAIPWIVISLLGATSLLILTCSILVCAITKKLIAKTTKKEEEYTIRHEDD